MDRLKRYQLAHTTLRCVILAVVLYGSGMVLAGRTVAGTLFDALGFGPTSYSLDTNGTSYAVFCFGVLGAVIVGWMISLYTLLQLCAAPMANCEMGQLARRGLFLSASIWFVFDTTFSIVISQPNHALFNIPFALLLMIPLYVMHKNDGDFGDALLSDENEVVTKPDYGTTQ
jgi:hypothetical protein